MNIITFALTVKLVFIVVMTLILKGMENEKIIYIGDFFKKVLPKIPSVNFYNKKDKK